MGMLKNAQQKAGRTKLSGQGKKPLRKAMAKPAAANAIADQDPERIKQAQDPAPAIAAVDPIVIKPAEVSEVKTKSKSVKEVAKEQEATWIKILEVVAGVVAVAALIAIPILAAKLKQPDE